MIRRILLFALLVAGLAAGCFVVGQRARVESRNKAVELVIDYEEVREIAAATSRTPVDVMRKFASVGMTSVAVTEQTMRDAIEDHLVTPYSEQQFAVAGEVATRIASHLKRALPALSGRIVITPLEVTEAGRSKSYSYLTIGEKIPMSYLQEIPIGLPEDALADASEAGLGVVARLVNYNGATPGAINAILKDVSAVGAKKVIFFGDQVLGFKGAVKYTGQAFLRNKLYFGRVEFARQKGELELAEKAAGNVIVVHSITQNEMPTLDISTIVERFRKGVRERGVRMCYVRMYYTAAPDLMWSNAEYIASIARGIRGTGYTLKASHPLEELKIPTYVRSIAGAGVAAGMMFLILSIVDLSAAATVVWAVVLILICAGLPWVGESKAVALLSAVAFPTLAVLNCTRRAPEAPTEPRRLCLGTLGRFVLAVLTASAGGLLIVGLLSDRAFMLRIDQFAGVKVAHMLPFLVLVLLYVGGIAWKSAAWGLQKKRLARNLREVIANPLLIWEGIGIVLILGLVGMMLMRSGNDGGVEVSGVELKFRSLLDKLLFVRPRTKEFLIGYPALVSGIAFALRGRRRWAAPLVIIGSIGLVSALNTFCHIHTPLVLSALRVMIGAVIGAILGAVLYAILRRVES